MILLSERQNFFSEVLCLNTQTKSKKFNSKSNKNAIKFVCNCIFTKQRMFFVVERVLTGQKLNWFGVDDKQNIIENECARSLPFPHIVLIFMTRENYTHIVDCAWSCRPESKSNSPIPTLRWAPIILGTTDSSNNFRWDWKHCHRYLFLLKCTQRAQKHGLGWVRMFIHKNHNKWSIGCQTFGAYQCRWIIFHNKANIILRLSIVLSDYKLKFSGKITSLQER